MLKKQEFYNIHDIELKVIYSSRRTLGISVLTDSTVIVRVPYHTSLKTITRIVQQKSEWIIKHRDNYRENAGKRPGKTYLSGEVHLFRGNELLLKVEKSKKKYHHFNDNSIELGLNNYDDPKAIKELLYKGYKSEAVKILPYFLATALKRYENQNFKPSGLVIRTMKRRWGSCSGSSLITLSVELIKLPDIFIEYVVIHELCHLKHHNHGKMYYQLLSGLFPDWRNVRKELRKYIQL